MTEETSINLKRVLDKVSHWLDQDPGDPYDVGLPSVIHTSIARNSPDVYLLLMWLASIWLDTKADESLRDHQKQQARRSIIGLAVSSGVKMDQNQRFEIVAAKPTSGLVMDLARWAGV